MNSTREIYVCTRITKFGNIRDVNDHGKGSIGYDEDHGVEEMHEEDSGLEGALIGIGKDKKNIEMEKQTVNFMTLIIILVMIQMIKVEIIL